MRRENPEEAPKGPRFNPSEIAERILREAPIDRDPIASEKYQEERLFRTIFTPEGKVEQSHHKVSNLEVLWSEGFKSCTAVILRAANNESMLIHAEAGHWHPLDKRWEADEAAKQFVKDHPEAKMIIVRRKNWGYADLFNIKLGHSLLDQLQVPLVKIIEVYNEYPDSDVAYDPVADQIYVNQGGYEELLTYKGFQG